MTLPQTESFVLIFSRRIARSFTGSTLPIKLFLKIRKGPCTMAPQIGGAISMPDVETSRHVEALDRKRKQLDLEVAEFRANKDEEYRVFEQQFRYVRTEEDKRNGPDDVARSSQERGRPQERGSSQGGVVQENGSTGILLNGFGVDSIEGQARSSYLSDVPNVQKDPVVGSFLHEHEREEEFHGLFTPSYLPLLENTPQGQRRGSREALLSPLFNTQEAPRSGRNTAQGFSSSATLPTTSFNASPPPPSARPLAASVPHCEDLHGRRDNSIAGLRSSMRDPKASRSPKRVLFSIDDVVVSPSTSPIAQRSNKGLSSKTVGPFDMASISQKDDNARNGKYQDYGVTDWEKGLSTTSERYGFHGFPPSAILNGRPSAFTTLSQPQPAVTASPLTGGEDFEHVNDEDELFTFDEDIDLGDLKDQKENGDGDLRSDEEEDRKEDIPESSPHAGSLPIEIKWPVRHASGN